MDSSEKEKTAKGHFEKGETNKCHIEKKKRKWTFP